MNGTDVSIFIMNQVAVNKILEDDEDKKKDDICHEKKKDDICHEKNQWYHDHIKKRTEMLKEKFARRKK